MKRPLFTPFCWRQRLYLFSIILSVAISCATGPQESKESVATVCVEKLIPETIVTEEVLIPEEVDGQLAHRDVFLPEVSENIEVEKGLILEEVDMQLDKKNAALLVTNSGVEELAKESKGQRDDYEAILSVDEQFLVNKAGELLVSIAFEGNSDVPTVGKVQDTVCFPAHLVQYATVKPIAPGFTVDPVCRSCVKIDPSGSDFSFILTPNKKGSFKIGADVILYTSSPCETDGVPRTVHSLSVEVKVDRKENLELKLNEVFTVVWDSFIKFWKALVALLFGLFLYLIRRRIKAKTGYGQKED